MLQALRMSTQERYVRWKINYASILEQNKRPRVLQELRMSAQQRFVRWKINYAHISQKWFCRRCACPHSSATSAGRSTTLT